MTQLIKVCYRNILENSTITVSSENASFPKYRLYDRDITKLFKFNAADDPSLITLDQGAVTSHPVSRLFIPVGQEHDHITVLKGSVFRSVEELPIIRVEGRDPVLMFSVNFCRTMNEFLQVPF